MTTPATLTELLQRARREPRSLTYLEGDKDERVVSFEDLYQRALGILYHLQRLGAKSGDQMILQLASNEAFIDGFWAAVLGGIVPVPVAVGISDEHRSKLLRIAGQLNAPYFYTDRKNLTRIVEHAAASGESAIGEALKRRAFLVDELEDISRSGRVFAAKPNDTGFIQFSSGSTSEPKGVVLTHGNLIANWQGAAKAAGFNRDDVALSWMPLTHDMGLIGMHIMMIGSHAEVMQMPTELFVRRPLLWLQFASRKRATILCSPNFGYRHYLKVLGGRAVNDLDLSALRVIFNGAEPIGYELAQEFIQRLAPARLPPRVMFPVYGLAEASVAVSFPPLGAALKPAHFDRHQMAVGQTARLVNANDPQALTLVAVGSAVPQCELRIADDADQALANEHIGHIQIRGANVTHGYFNRAEANKLLHTGDGWVRTGDLGVVHHEQLYVTGRAKEIIFVNGQNYYPYDLEAIAQRAEGMELGKVVVSGIRPDHAATDQVVVFALHRGSTAEFLPIATQIARLLNEQTGLEIEAVVPIKRVPKTTSGKVQRHLLEDEYRSGTYANELAELKVLAAAQRRGGVSSQNDIEARIKAICDAALDGRVVGVTENLFELGASSLKLIEIHEQIDATWPGHVDLTELFDYPTIRELAQHLESKTLAAT
jgi:acyl-CoA synthetase (AMP-forming)/AMP-acid ligase II